MLIKLGSNSIVLGGGEVNVAAIEWVADQAKELVGEGHTVALVSSGFGAAGDKTQEGYEAGGRKLHAAYAAAFGDAYGGMYLVDSLCSLRSVASLIREAQRQGKICVVNECRNSMFGNNDRLSGELATLLGAQRVFFLGRTGVCGLYEDFGKESQRLVTAIPRNKIIDYIQFTNGTSEGGTGGMLEKLLVAAELGATVHIGEWSARISDLAQGRAGTTIGEAQEVAWNV